MEQLFFQGLLRAKHDLEREETLCNQMEKGQLSWGPHAGLEGAQQTGNQWISQQDKSR